MKEIKSIEDINKIKLTYFAPDDKEELQELAIDCDYKVPSMAVQDKILDIFDKQIAELDVIDKEFADFAAIQQQIIDEYGEYKMEYLDGNGVKRAIEKKKIISQIQSKYVIDYFKEIINTKQLTTDKKELINLSNDSMFWRMQNIVAIQEAVSSFRVLAGV